MSQQNHNHSPSYATDPNTMFVQADPSNFRNIVQKLTGAPPEVSASVVSAAQQKLPLTPKKPAFKLHERRQSSKKMELKLNNITNDSFSHFHRGFLVSPVSHLDPLWARVSPHSAREDHHAPPDKEEQKLSPKKGSTSFRVREAAPSQHRSFCLCFLFVLLTALITGLNMINRD